MASDGETGSILVIDDEPAFTLILSDVFGCDTVSVTASFRLDMAEQVLRRRRFDLVIADVYLRGVLPTEGHELQTFRDIDGR